MDYEEFCRGLWKARLVLSWKSGDSDGKACKNDTDRVIILMRSTAELDFGHVGR